MSRIWRKNFEIKRVDFNIAAEAMDAFYVLQDRTIGCKVITGCLWLIKNLDNVATYFPRNELRSMIELTMQAIVRKPFFIDRIHKQTIHYNERYFKLTEKMRRLNLSRLSNSALLAHHKRLYHLMCLSHGWSLPTTWFVDSDGEDFSKYLLKIIESRRLPGSAVDPATAFSLLTTLGRRSLGQQEEQESLAIVSYIKRNSKLSQWFMRHTTNELVEQFDSLPASVRKRLYHHYEKWCWFPYTYLGPAYDLAYYLEVWRGLLHEGVDPSKELKQLASKVKSSKEARMRLVSDLRLPPYERHLFDIAAEIVWLKGFRKDCYFHGFYVLDLLLAEVARRAGLSLLQAKYLLPTEMSMVLRGKDFADKTNDRMKLSLVYLNKGKIRVMTGSVVGRFLKSQKLEREKRAKLHELRGTCACPGKAEGVVKVINTPDDIPKMKSGDIMLSHTTFPSLVPAMKKAAAIVTEDGGITCHAAIVSRELQTPCIVGCKGILGVLKDGDRVQVDANNGIVKKLT